MFISQIRIKNFRSIKDTSVRFFSRRNNTAKLEHLVSLVGGNESGKSNILFAIDKFITRQPFNTDDKYQLTDKPIEIEIVFKPSEQEIKNFGGIKKLIINRLDNDYSIKAPDIEKLKFLLNEEELNVEAPSEEEKEKIINQKVVEKIFTQKLPKLVFVPNIYSDELLKGKNLKWEDLEPTWTDPNFNPRLWQMTVKNFLSIGKLSREDLIIGDLHERTKRLTKGAAIISDEFSEEWKQEPIKIQILFSNNQLVIHFKDGKNYGQKESLSIWTAPEDRSLGFQWWATFYSKFLAGTQFVLTNLLFLFDDPGLPLNAAAQRELLDRFKKISSMGNQVIYATHSPELVDWRNRYSIRLVDKAVTKGTIVSEKWWKRYQWKDLPEPLKAIGYSTARQVFKDYNLIVEGDTDRDIILELYKLFREDEDLIMNRFAIIPAGSASEVKHLASYIKAEGRKYLALYDSDKTGLDELKRALTNKLNAKDIKAVVVPPESVVVETIEDLLPPHLYIKALNETHSKLYGSSWKKIIRLRGNKNLGIIERIKKRIKRIDQELDLKKALVTQKIFTFLSKEDFDDARKRVVNNLLDEVESICL